MINKSKLDGLSVCVYLHQRLQLISGFHRPDGDTLTALRLSPAFTQLASRGPTKTHFSCATAYETVGLGQVVIWLRVSHREQRRFLFLLSLYMGHKWMKFERLT